MKNKEYYRLSFSHKKWISIILSLCLLFSMMPAASFYAEDEVTQSGGGSTENEGGPGEAGPTTDIGKEQDAEHTDENNAEANNADVNSAEVSNADENKAEAVNGEKDSRIEGAKEPDMLQTRGEFVPIERVELRGLPDSSYIAFEFVNNHEYEVEVVVTPPDATNKEGYTLETDNLSIAEVIDNKKIKFKQPGKVNLIFRMNAEFEYYEDHNLEPDDDVAVMLEQEFSYYVNKAQAYVDVINDKKPEDDDLENLSIEMYDGRLGEKLNVETDGEGEYYYGFKASTFLQLLQAADAYTREGQEKIRKYYETNLVRHGLRLSYPEDWGQLRVKDSTGLVQDEKIGRKYLFYPSHKYDEASGFTEIGDGVRKATFTFSNNKGKEATVRYKRDEVPEGVYTLRLLKNNPSGTGFAAVDGEVEVSYINGAGKAVKKTIAPSPASTITFYEPEGILVDEKQGELGGLLITQKKDGKLLYYAYLSDVENGRRGELNLKEKQKLYQEFAEIIVNKAKSISHNYSLPPIKAVVMKAPGVKAYFRAREGISQDGRISYALIDDKGAVIEDTAGSLEIKKADEHSPFELNCDKIMEHPEASLFVEYDFGEGSPRASTYDFDLLQQMKREHALISYEYTKNEDGKIGIVDPKTLFITETAGAKRLVHYEEGRLVRMKKGESLSLAITTGQNEIKKASISIKDLSKEEPDATYSVSLSPYDTWKFTENKYYRVNFDQVEKLTLGKPSYVALNLEFKDGSKESRVLFYAVRLPDDKVYETEEEVRELLEAKEPDLFTAKRLSHDLKLVDIAFTHDHKEVYGFKGDDTSDTYKYMRALHPEIMKAIKKIVLNPVIKGLKKPLIFDVKRDGEDYILKAYVDIRNKAKTGWVLNSENQRGLSYDKVFDRIKRTVLLRGDKSLDQDAGIMGFLEGRAVRDNEGRLHYHWANGKFIVNTSVVDEPVPSFKIFDRNFKARLRAQSHMTVNVTTTNKGDTTLPFNLDYKVNRRVPMQFVYDYEGEKLYTGLYELKTGIYGGIYLELGDGNGFAEIHYDNSNLLRTTYDFRLNFIGDLWASYFRRDREDDGSYTTKRSLTLPVFYTEADNVGSSKTHEKWYKSGSTYKNLGAVPPGYVRCDIDMADGYLDYETGNEYGSSDPKLNIKAKDDLANTAPKSMGLYFKKDGDEIVASLLKNGDGVIPENALGLDVATYRPLKDEDPEKLNALATWVVAPNTYEPDDVAGLDEKEALEYKANQSDIRVKIYENDNWKAEIKITDNNGLADLNPKAAVNGEDGIVVWAQGKALIEDRDGAMAGVQPKLSLNKSRLMYSSYRYEHGLNEMNHPLEVWASEDTGLGILDYAVVMDEDKNSVIALVTSDGKVHLYLISADGFTVEEIHNDIEGEARLIAESENNGPVGIQEPSFTKVDLVYNGAKGYTLACYDGANSKLSMYALDNRIFVKPVRYINLPENTGGNFKLLRDWNDGVKGSEGIMMATLFWIESKLGDSMNEWYPTINRELLASKIAINSKLPKDATHAIVSDPVVMYSSKEICYIDDFKALVYDGEKDDDVTMAILASEGDNTNGKLNYAFLGNYKLIQATSRFSNGFEVYEDYSDFGNTSIYGDGELQFAIKNRGYAPLTSFTVSMVDNREYAQTLLPGEEFHFYHSYPIVANPLSYVNPGDSWTPLIGADYSANLKDIFKEIDHSTLSAKVNTSEGDISVSLLDYRYDKAEDEIKIKALITNHSPFYINEGRKVKIGVYKELVGKTKLLETVEIDGEEFNKKAEIGGINRFIKSAVKEISFKREANDEAKFYLIARIYEDKNNDHHKDYVYDRNYANNVLVLDNLKYEDSSYSEGGEGDVDYTLFLKKGKVYKNSEATENEIEGSDLGIKPCEFTNVDGELITKWEFQNFNFKTSNKVAMIVDSTECKNVLLFSGDSSIVTTYEGTEDSYGLQITGNRDDYVIRGSGQLTVKAGKTSGKSYGIYSPGMNSASFMNTLKVRALGGEGDGESYGLYLAENNHKLKFADTVNVILSGNTGPYHNSKEGDLNNTLFKYRGSPDYNADTVSGALTYQDGKWMVGGDVALTLSISPKNQQDTPDATFEASGYDTGILSNLSAAWVYSLDNGENWIKLDTIEESTLELKDLVATEDGLPGIKLKHFGDGVATLDSEVQTIFLKRQTKPEGVEAEACTTAANNDGKLKGITADMEYKAKGADEWTTGTGADITDLKNGVYLVRTKCKAALLSSDSIEVVIKAFEGGGDPGGNDPGGNDPGGNDPGGNDPGGNDPGGNDPGGNDPGGNDHGDGDTTGSVDTGTTANDDYQEYNPDVTIEDNKTPTSPKEKTLEDKIKALLARIEAASKLKPKHFDDIIGHWARPYIEFIANLNVMQGYQNLFKPNDNMTRAQLITALGRVDDIDVSKYVENEFSDVKDDAYYKNFVQWAKEAGIIKGNGDGKFAPENSITREELAVIFASYARYLGYDLKLKIKTGEEHSKTFTDEAKMSSWAKNDVKLLQGVGLMIGQPDGSFNPQGNLTRAEGATVLERFIKLLVK